MGKLISPMQVCRFDGNKVFVELMADGLSMNKIYMNFCNYDKSAQVGNRMVNTIAIYIDIPKAAVLAEDILSGKMEKLAKKSKEEAAARGSKYPREIFRNQGGTKPSDARREDGKAESRQLMINPGSKFPWMLTAVKGPGKLSPTGLITPEYTTGKGAEAIIRVPFTDESIKSLAIQIKNLVNLWFMEKFGPLNSFTPEDLTGYQKCGMRKTSLIGYFEQRNPDGMAGLHMNLRVNHLPIDKALLEFTPSPWSIDSWHDKAKLSFYLKIEEAAVLATDILSGKLAKLGKLNRDSGKQNEPVFSRLGGTTNKTTGQIISRQLKIYNKNPGEWDFLTMRGPGHKSDTGLYVPEYNEQTAEVLYSLRLNDEDVKRFALYIQQMFTLWTIKKFGPLVEPGMRKQRKEAEERLAQIKNN